MGCRQVWEDIYALEVYQSGTSLSAICANPPSFSTTHGVRGGYTGGGALTPKYNLLVDDAYPIIKAANQIVEKNLVTGTSLPNVISMTPVTAKPEAVTVPLVYNAHNLSCFIKMFFQDGVTLAAGTTNTALQIMTCIPYASACPTFFGNLVRFRQDDTGSDEVDQVLHGVLPTRILIRGEEGGLVDGEVEFLGAKWEDYDLTTKLATASGFDSTTPLKFEDLTVKIDGVEVSIPSFEITIENGLVHQYYNQVSAQSVTLGRLNVTGSITVPWNDPSAQGIDKQIDDYRAGNLKRISLVWGNASFSQFTQGLGAPNTSDVDVLPASAKNLVSNNYFAVHVYARVTDYDESDIDENPMITINFRTIIDASNTINGTTIRAAYAVASNTWT